MLKQSNLKDGDIVKADGGFTCVKAGPVTIHKDENGLYFDCKEGKHYLIGQLGKDNNTLIGLSR